MSTVVSEHREKMNANILSQLGAKMSVIKALTGVSSKSIAKYSGKEQAKLRQTKKGLAKEDPTTIIEAQLFLEIFSSLNNVKSEHYSLSSRFIMAYNTFCDFLPNGIDIGINGCYIFIENSTNERWMGMTCIRCEEKYQSILGVEDCPACRIAKKVTCTKCGGYNDFALIDNKNRTRGRPRTQCNACSSSELAIDGG
jgi:hypothetical protein